jgi:hypothetical protein
MASITYILQFRGKGTPGPDPTKLKIKSAADSLNVSTMITYMGVASTSKCARVITLRSSRM